VGPLPFSILQESMWHQQWFIQQSPHQMPASL